MSAALEVKERPIIFSGPMVRAIIEGRKTQTRRVALCMTGTDFATHHNADEWVISSTILNIAVGLPQKAVSPRTGNLVRCPYGKIGDRLWVRETFTYHTFSAGRNGGSLPIRLVFKADNELHGVKWKSPLFLPRNLSRITLGITNIRVERVQEISEKDAQAEGVKVRDVLYADEPFSAYSYVEQFKLGWDSINAKRGYSWESNPWVWVIEFKKLETSN